MTVEGDAPCFPQRALRWLSLLFAFCSRLLTCFVQVMLFWNVTPRNVASLLILIFWLYSVRLALLLGCRCGFFVKRTHCVLAGFSLILHMLDQFSISVMHVWSFLAARFGHLELDQ